MVIPVYHPEPREWALRRGLKGKVSPQIADILVRRGAARSDRVTALLDWLKESGAGPVQLRVLIQASLPRDRARAVQLEYQRITSRDVESSATAVHSAQ
jgi:hypothetical protein